MNKKAIKYIKSNRLDLESNNRMDTTGYVKYAVSEAKAYGAITIAEEEMRKKAIQAYCLDSCLVHDVNNRKEILSCCNEECPLIAKFIKNLE